MKGGFELGTIHEGIKATNGILHLGVRCISPTWDPNIRKGDYLASLDFRKGTVDYELTFNCDRKYFIKSQDFDNFEVSKESHHRTILLAKETV